MDPREQLMEEEMETFSTPDVFLKYRIACEVVNSVMQKVIAEAKPGKKIVELCSFGDAQIVAELTKALKGMTRPEDKDEGVSFPTSISVNHTAGHFSPLADDKTVLAAGDICKIDMGAHVDGFPAVLAQTIVVPGSDAQVTDKRADVIMAAYAAVQACACALRPGAKNTAITDIIERVAKAYGVTAMEGVLSHQVYRYVIDGEKVIMNHPTAEQHVDDFEVEPWEVYGLDIVMSTGEGKARDNGETKATIFKRNPDVQYLLKFKASRFLLSEINTKFPAFPFTIRACSDEKRAKLGVTEMSTHGLLDAYPVLFEKQGETVAQFKVTVFVLPEVTTIGTGIAAGLLPAGIKSEKTAVAAQDEVLRAAVATPVVPFETAYATVGKKKKSKSKSAAKKKAKKEAADPTNPAPTFTPPAQPPVAMEVDKTAAAK